jgi:hypothetical protein
LAQQTGCAKVTPKRPEGLNQLAKSIIDIRKGEKPDRDPTPELDEWAVINEVSRTEAIRRLVEFGLKAK